MVGRECKFIARISGEAKADRLGWAQYLWLGYPLGKRTLFKGIDRAPGGLFLRANLDRGFPEGGLQQTWVLNLDEKDESQHSATESGAALADLLRSVVATRARAHQSVNNVLSLSGGHDSRTVAVALRGEECRFFSVSQGLPDSSSRADARVAARVATVLESPWTLIPLAVEPPDEEELVWLKDGLNYVGTAFMLPYLRAIRDRWGADAAYWTGDGGDKVFPDLRPRPFVQSEDSLVSSLVAGHALLDASVAEKMTKVPAGSLISSLRTVISGYPERDARQKGVHFSFYERGRKWLYEGEDRNRFFLWQVSPFYAAPFFRRAMRVPDRFKERYSLYRAAQRHLGTDVIRIPHAQLGVSVGSMFFPWKLGFDAALRRLPRPLKSWLKLLIKKPMDEASASGRLASPRAEWAESAARAIRNGFPMALEPTTAFVHGATKQQFDMWRTLMILERSRSSGRYSVEAWQATSQ